MRLNGLFVDDDAVSPVIGVILMVAITVILAAVIGAFVMGFGDPGEPMPSAQWSADEDPDNHYVNFTHDGGEAVEISLLSDGRGVNNVSIGKGSNPLQSGDELAVGVDNSSVESGDVVIVIWAASGSAETQPFITHTLQDESWG